MGKRYGKTPAELLANPPEDLALIIGVYYYARGEEAKDEWYRKARSGELKAPPGYQPAAGQSRPAGT